MDILKTLKFVKGAVSKKSLVPAMQHFVIKDGEIRSFDGVLALSSPIDLDIECAPRAIPFVESIAKCEDVVSLGLTPANRLRVQSGGFKSFVECTEMEDLPHLVPQGELIDLNGGASLLEAMKALLPFVGNDASRQWTNGVLLRNASAFATNNVCLAEYWIGVEMPFVVNIPVNAVKEIVRIDEPPTHVMLHEHSISFLYEDGRWIRSQLYDIKWPDLAKVLDTPCNPVPVPEGLFEALATVKGFTTTSVHIRNGGLFTTTEDELGASCSVEGLDFEGIYMHKMLALLEGIEKADFSTYPKPCMFFKGKLRGAIVGLRS